MNRKDVSDKVNKFYYGCEVFFSIVVDEYVVYVVMEFFGMEFFYSIFSLNIMGFFNIFVL